MDDKTMQEGRDMEARQVNSSASARDALVKRLQTIHDDSPHLTIKQRADIAAAIAALSPAGVVVPDGELWSWLKKVMEQGAAIHQDYQSGKHPTYEHYSSRMDAAASERIDELVALLAAAKEPKK